jgi:hypothetical protein
MLAAISKQSPQENQEDFAAQPVFRRIWSFPRPMIAAVNGHALTWLHRHTLRFHAQRSGSQVRLHRSANRAFTGNRFGFPARQMPRAISLTSRLVEAKEAKSRTGFRNCRAEN